MGLPGESAFYDVLLHPARNGFIATSTEHLAYVTRRTDADRTAFVPATQVDALLKAVASPIRARPIPSDFGATQAWLDSNADQAFAEFLSPGSGQTGGFYSQAQRALYIRSFTNERTVSATLLNYYSQPPWTDDYIDLTVDVRFKNWQHLTIESRQPRAPMLPWTVSTLGHSYKTFDPGLSAAIGGLVPDQAVRYGRLRSRGVLQELPDLLGEYIEPAWEKAPAFDVRELIDPLEKEYGVRIYGPDASGGNAPSVWDARVEFPGLPPNVTATVYLPVVHDAFTGTRRIGDAKRFAEQVYAVPWLRRFLDSHSNVTVKVLLERGGSSYLDDNQQRALIADLRAAGKTALVTRLKPLLQTGFKVMIGEQYAFSEWIVFPNSEMLLWDYYDAHPTRAILDLDAAALAGKRCASSEFLCSSFMRNPDGTAVN